MRCDRPPWNRPSRAGFRRTSAETRPVKRIHASALALPFLAAALLAADPAPPPAPAASPDSTADSTAAALEALHREVQPPILEEDPFEGGPTPDLVVLSSTDVHGETGPCG